MNRGKTDWNKSFPVRSITREDIFRAGFPRWQVAGLTDEEMNKIASMMGVSYTDSFFAEDLESATTFVLCNKAKPNIIGELA